MSQKRMFEVKCTECGKATTVPFEPTKGKPVYCRTCFAKHRTNKPERSTVGTRFDMKNAWAVCGNNRQKRNAVHQSVFKK